ncbi:MAG: hypothetical protein RLZZ34_1516 [Verrucomicrobiota bacterium]|jgi:hypothetical protein
MNPEQFLPCRPTRGSHPGGMVWVLLTAIMALGTGCSTVEPWQRRTLSDAVMRGDRDPAGLLLAEHMWFSREAATGGRGVGGGGCGCN